MAAPGITRILLLATLATSALASGVSVELFHGARIVVSNESDVAVNGTGHWLITMEGGCNDSDVASLAVGMPTGTSAVYSGHPDKGGLCLFVMTGTMEQVMEELESHNLTMEKVIAEADEDVELPETFDDEGRVEDIDDEVPWGLDRIDQRDGLDDEYESPGRQGAGVHVFVFDTGIYFDHDQFEGRAVPYIDMTDGGADICTEDGGREGDSDADEDDFCAEDLNGHGTHCAGSVAGRDVGVAPRARLFSVKVLSDRGPGRKSWGIEALDMVLSRNEPQGKVVSMSVSGRPSPAQDEAIAWAVGRGLAVVVAAGNRGARGPPAGEACSYSPARVRAAITVGSTNDEDERSWFSSYGSCVDIFAPGSEVVSADGRWSAREDDLRLMSGTSMACPHVAGAVALLLSENRHLSPFAVRQMIMDASLKGLVEDPRGAANKLLYVGDFGEED